MGFLMNFVRSFLRWKRVMDLHDLDAGYGGECWRTPAPRREERGEMLGVRDLERLLGARNLNEDVGDHLHQ